MKDPMALIVVSLLAMPSVVGCQCDSSVNPPNATVEQPQGFGMAAPDEPQFDSFERPAVTEIRHSKFSDNGQGFTDMQGCHIAWRGDTSNGVDSLDVVNATIARMQWEQSREAFASDQNAQALFHLMQARQTLEGKTTITEDGLPIIE